jgi:hypothetical protein
MADPGTLKRIDEPEGEETKGSRERARPATGNPQRPLGSHRKPSGATGATGAAGAAGGHVWRSSSPRPTAGPRGTRPSRRALLSPRAGR